MIQPIKRLQGIGGLGVSLWVVLTVVMSAPGLVLVALVLLHPLEIVNEAIKGRLDPFWWVILSLIALGAFIATVVRLRFLRSARTVTKIIAPIAIAIGCATLPVGAFVWIVMGLRETELELRLPMVAAQTVLGFSILWSGRVLAGLVASFRIEPRFALRGIVRGLIASAAAATLGATIAVGRGLEPSPFEPPHWFYVLAIPAIAGFGWTAPQPQIPSKLFGVLALTLVLTTTLYGLARAYSGLPDIECDMHVFNPHYDVGGFEWEPWRWSQKAAWGWIFAPNALTELSLVYIFEPVPNVVSPKGGHCPQ